MPAHKPAIALESLPVELVAIVQLFEAHLAQVRFPDVDLERLRELAADVARANGAVDRAREALDIAERDALAAVDTLAAAARRGLAYARIYADADPAREPLRAAITDVASPSRIDASPAAKRRGRPRKVTADAPAQSLFAEAATE